MTQDVMRHEEEAAPHSGAGRYHYEVIRRAIALIDQGGSDLSLAELSAQMGMSPSHFQRLFSEWAGVSPKRYQQYLKLSHAKSLLAARQTTLATAHEVGLSGSGRLHDLFLRWEAMSPGEYAKKGAGLTVRWGVFDTGFGEALVMGTEKGICGIGFAAELGTAAVFDDLAARWPRADFQQDPEALAPWVGAAFGAAARAGGDRAGRDRAGRAGAEVPLHLIGAPMQLKVWEALLRIPDGALSTYGAIASAIGNPKASRAVGTAVGRNPISWLIPCHRVLRQGGAIGGYHWGLPVKRAMLTYEAVQADLHEAKMRAGA